MEGMKRIQEEVGSQIAQSEQQIDLVLERSEQTSELISQANQELKGAYRLKMKERFAIVLLPFMKVGALLGLVKGGTTGALIGGVSGGVVGGAIGSLLKDSKIDRQ